VAPVDDVTPALRLWQTFRGPIIVTPAFRCRRFSLVDPAMPDSSAPAAATITLRLVYLARLREAFGMAGESLPIAAEGATVGKVLATLRARGGAWAHELAPGRAVRVAVNHDLVTDEASVRAGDEVALLPPVTGG